VVLVDILEADPDADGFFNTWPVEHVVTTGVSY